MKKFVLCAVLPLGWHSSVVVAAPARKAQKSQVDKDKELVEVARSEGDNAKGRQRVIQLLQEGANPAAFKSGAFSWAIGYGNFGVLNTFAKYHAPLPSHSFSMVNSENGNAPQIYRWLLSHGAKPDFTDLRRAIQSEGRPDQLLKILLDAGAEANGHGWCIYEKKVWSTPLMVAAQCAGTPGYAGPQFSDGRMIKALLAHGAKINERTKDGRTALDFALLVEAPINVRVLLQNGASVGKLAPRVLDIGVSRNDPLILDELDKRKLLPKKLSFVALRFPTGSGVVKRLLAHGANPNEADSIGATELEWAAGAGQAESVRMLLDAGANIETPMDDGKTALFGADTLPEGGEKGNLAQQLLLERGANPNARDKNGLTPLIYATLSRDRGFGNEKAVQLLCAHGADPTLKDNAGNTALHYAVTWSLNMVKAMLGANSSPEFLEERDGDGNTAFLVAMSSKGGPYMSEQAGNTMTAIFQTLLKAGAKADAVDSEGNTAFHLCQFEAERLQVLHSLKPGLSCDVPNALGFTPLYVACFSGNVDAAYQLLQFGANPDTKAKDGLSPRMVASQPFSPDNSILSPGERRNREAIEAAFLKQMLQAAKPTIDTR